MQSVLGDDSSPSDKLVVNDGTLTGTTSISVNNLGGTGAATLQNGIQVVQAQGTAVSDSGAFTLKAPLSAGAFDYQLFKGGVTAGSENSWYLRSSVVAPPLVAVRQPGSRLAADSGSTGRGAQPGSHLATDSGCTGLGA